MTNTQVVGLDLGRSNIKLFTGTKYIWFPAVVGEARELRLTNTDKDQMYKAQFRGSNYFVGELAIDESEFPRQMLIDSKDTDDALLSALVALSQTDHEDFDIITGLPVEMHSDAEKGKIITMLEGNHEITVNDVKKTIRIHRVRVAVEGGGAFWSNPQDGLVRIIDGGSKTINYVSLKDRKYIDRDSGTLPFGFSTNKSGDTSQMIERIAGELGKKWGQRDTIYTVGGEAESLANHLRKYFININVLHPHHFVYHLDKQIDLNLFANAKGYYEMGMKV